MNEDEGEGRLVELALVLRFPSPQSAAVLTVEITVFKPSGVVIGVADVNQAGINRDRIFRDVSRVADPAPPKQFFDSSAAKQISAELLLFHFSPGHRSGWLSGAKVMMAMRNFTENSHGPPRVFSGMMELDRSLLTEISEKPANKKEWIPVKGDSGDFPQLRYTGPSLPFKPYLKVISPINEDDIRKPHCGLVLSSLQSGHLF